MKRADLKKKKEEEAASKEKDLTRLKLQERLQECKRREEEACRLKEAKKERDELLNTPPPLVILEGVTAEEPSTSTASGPAEVMLESTLSIKEEPLTPKRVIISFKSFEDLV